MAPEFREFERLSTTAVNAYLGPVMEGYIRRLSARLRDLGLAVTPQLTQSNGGVIGFEAAARLPVVGSRLRVWWPGESAWFAGEVLSCDGAVTVVRYDDGEQHDETLQKERWEPLEERQPADDGESSSSEERLCYQARASTRPE